MRIERRLAFVGLLSGLAWMGLSSGACSDDHDDTDHEEQTDLADVIYVGANDEALYALVTATVKDDAAQEAALDTPKADAALPATPAASFAWHVGGSGTHLAPPSTPSRSPWETVHGWLGVREAHAHGTPVNGRGYFLVFSTAKSDKLLRVFTTELTYTPDAAAWSKLTSAGAPITLTITNAIFEDSRVVQDGGPYRSDGVTFTVAK